MFENVQALYCGAGDINEKLQKLQAMLTEHENGPKLQAELKRFLTTVFNNHELSQLQNRTFAPFLAYALAMVQPNMANQSETAHIKKAFEFLFPKFTLAYTEAFFQNYTKEDFLAARYGFWNTGTYALTVFKSAPLPNTDPIALPVPSSDNFAATVLNSYQACKQEIASKSADSIDAFASKLYNETVLEYFETTVLPDFDTLALEEQKTKVTAFLRNRPHRFDKGGYTASPTDPANLFCVELAQTFIDPSRSDKNRALWEQLLHEVTGTHGFAESDDWPAYGQALLDDNLAHGQAGRLWSFPFLVHHCQSTEVFAQFQNTPLPDKRTILPVPDSQKWLIEFPKSSLPSANTWERIVNFMPTHFNFWTSQFAAITEQSEFQNLAEFFEIVKNILNKYKSDYTDGRGEDIGTEGNEAIAPYLRAYKDFTQQNRGQAFLKFAERKDTNPKIHELTIVMRNLLDPMHLPDPLDSCFNRNHKRTQDNLTEEVKTALIDFEISPSMRTAPALSAMGHDLLPHDNKTLETAIEAFSQSASDAVILTDINKLKDDAPILEKIFQIRQQRLLAQSSPIMALHNFFFQIEALAKRQAFLAPFLANDAEKLHGLLNSRNTPLNEYLLAIKMLQNISEWGLANTLFEKMLGAMADHNVDELNNLFLNIWRTLASKEQKAALIEKMVALGQHEFVRNIPPKLSSEAERVEFARHVDAFPALAMLKSTKIFVAKIQRMYRVAPQEWSTLYSQNKKLFDSYFNLTNLDETLKNIEISDDIFYRNQTMFAYRRHFLAPLAEHSKTLINSPSDIKNFLGLYHIQPEELTFLLGDHLQTFIKNAQDFASLQETLPRPSQFNLLFLIGTDVQSIVGKHNLRKILAAQSSVERIDLLAHAKKNKINLSAYLDSNGYMQDLPNYAAFGWMLALMLATLLKHTIRLIRAPIRLAISVAAMLCALPAFMLFLMFDLNYYDKYLNFLVLGFNEGSFINSHLAELGYTLLLAAIVLSGGMLAAALFPTVATFLGSIPVLGIVFTTAASAMHIVIASVAGGLGLGWIAATLGETFYRQSHIRKLLHDCDTDTPQVKYIAPNQGSLTNYYAEQTYRTACEAYHYLIGSPLLLFKSGPLNCGGVRYSHTPGFKAEGADNRHEAYGGSIFHSYSCRKY